MDERDFSAPLSSIFGLHDAAWILSWTSGESVSRDTPAKPLLILLSLAGLARDGGSGLLLLLGAFAVLLTFLQTISRALVGPDEPNTRI